jgi:hypothetical protein
LNLKTYLFHCTRFINQDAKFNSADLFNKSRCLPKKEEKKNRVTVLLPYLRNQSRYKSKLEKNKKMKSIKLLLIIMALLPLAMVCSNSTSADDIEEELTEDEPNGLAVRIVNTGDSKMEVETGGSTIVYFCYEDECEDDAGYFSYAEVNTGAEMMFDTSLPEKVAVGVYVGFEVTRGSGHFEIVSGVSYRDDDDWAEFDEVDVLYTSGTLSSGDKADYTFGNME